FVSEGPEERLGRSVLRLDKCREHPESLLTKDALARSHEPARDRSTTIVRMDCETVDPALASIARAQDHTRESVSIEGAQVRAAIAAKLFAEGSRAVPSLRLWIQARDLEQCDHRLVVGSKKRTDLNRHGHASLEIRCRVGCTKCSRASRGNSSRRNGGISADERSPARGTSRMRMCGSRLGMYPAVSGAGNSEF